MLKSFEREEKLKNHEKALYMILGNSKKPKDCVWSLLKNSENNGEILWKDIDYLLISTMFSPSNELGPMNTEHNTSSTISSLFII